MKKLLPFLLILLAVFTGCSDDEDETKQVTTSLEITVTDFSDNKLSSAFVTIYADGWELEYEKNKVATLVTDNEGKVLFKNLKPIQYFIDVKKGCFSNRQGTGRSTGLSMIANREHYFTVKAVESGTIRLSNNSGHTYYAHVRGFDRTKVPSRSTVEVPYALATDHEIIVYPEGALWPNGQKKYYGSLACGGLLLVEIPK